MKSDNTITRSTIIYRVLNTLSKINDLPEKDDLRQWSPKARRSLRLAGDISLVVGPKCTSIGETLFPVPKLALMVASPTMRDLIINQPEVMEIKLAEGRFERRAIGILCYWLNSICDWNAQAVPYLPCPDDLLQALQLRYAAQLLYMDKYVQTFEIRYFLNIQYRTPSLVEATAVSKYTMDENDRILDAWASRLGHLRRTGALTLSYLEGLAKILVMKQHHKLLRALDEADTIFDTGKNRAYESDLSRNGPISVYWNTTSNHMLL